MPDRNMMMLSSVGVQAPRLWPSNRQIQGRSGTFAERFPRPSGSALLRALERADWQAERQRGSHVQLLHLSWDDITFGASVEKALAMAKETIALRIEGLYAWGEIIPHDVGVAILASVDVGMRFEKPLPASRARVPAARRREYWRVGRL